MTDPQIPIALLGSLLFTLVGPIALIPGFAALTRGADRSLVATLAVRSGLIAFAAFALAIFVGAAAMANAGTSPAALIVASGLVLLATALNTFFGARPASAEAPPAPTPALALAPLAIPNIVTPVGVAVLIIFASYFPSLSDRLAILGVVGGIVVANVIAMLFADAFMRRIGPAPLVFLGSVFGILQAGLGAEMVLDGIRLSGLVP